jgi:hypothetical protein
MFRPIVALALVASFGAASGNFFSQLSGPAERWYVYRDAGSKNNHGEWTNWMPAEAGQMVKLHLADEEDPNSGASCVRMDIKWAPPFWCGIAVSSATDYWGEKPGPAYDLRRAKRLVFSARGAKGGETIQVKVAIAGDKPHGDSAAEPAATRWLTLSKSWKRYSLDISNIDRGRVITPFAIVSSNELNNGNITVFIDDVFFTDGDD